MRVDLKSLLEKLGVKKELHPYETMPWLHYDDEKATTCSAEVRMGPGASDLEAEIQFLKDEDAEDESSKGEDDGNSENTPPNIPRQILYMRAEPMNDDKWTPKLLRVKGEDYMNKIADWEQKGCNFFKACIQSIQMGELPEIEDLIEKELPDDSGGGGRRGRIGRKSPKVKPGQLMGMKK